MPYPRLRALFAAFLMLACGAGMNRAAAAEAVAPAALTPRMATHRQLQAVLELQAQVPVLSPWFDAGGALTPLARRWIAEFEQADARGLDPADYRPRLRADLGHLPVGAASAWAEPGTVITDAPLRNELARELGRNALDLAWDLRFGRVAPQRLGFELAAEVAQADAIAMAADILAGTDPAALLDRLQPPFRSYRRLLQAYRNYLLLAQHAPPPLPELPARVLEPGQAYAGTAALAGLLRLLGDLDPTVPGAGAAGLYDAELVQAVTRFQQRHGLIPDGRLGPRSWRALNTPLALRAQQLYLSLERWRWLPHEFSQPPVVINIPEFRLRAYASDGSAVLDMPVQVGAALGRQTPVFAAPMRQVIFRPSWTVPLSILRRDLLARERADPGYLARHGFEVAGDPTRALDADTLEALRRGGLQLRQRPGEGNALGRVKFLLPNPHSIYLHDTPSVAAFAHERRDRSSGCIRVQDPQALAEWVLRDQPEWTRERIAEAMAKGPPEQAVRVTAEVPVYLLYATARVDAEGRVLFFDDIYGHDPRLQRALDSRSR